MGISFAVDESISPANMGTAGQSIRRRAMELRKLAAWRNHRLKNPSRGGS